MTSTKTPKKRQVLIEGRMLANAAIDNEFALGMIVPQSGVVFSISFLTAFVTNWSGFTLA